MNDYSWLIPIFSAVASLIVTGGILLFRSGRNVILMDDFKELEKQVNADRHTARSNMEQRTTIMLEKIDDARVNFDGKVDAVRDKFDKAIERIHATENRLTRVEARVNGVPHK